jgi:hypothetical protein
MGAFDLSKGVIDLSQFRKSKEELAVEEASKPLFDKPTVLTLGDPANPGTLINYNLLVNLTMDGKQYLAIQQNGTEDTEVALVEAVLDEEGKLSSVVMIENEEIYDQVADIVSKVLESDLAPGDTDADK